jgi:hypothetical protein
MSGDPILVVIGEREVDDPLLSNGAIIFESYTNQSPDQIRERAQQLADTGRFGRVWIGKVLIEEEIHKTPDEAPLRSVPAPDGL